MSTTPDQQRVREGRRPYLETCDVLTKVTPPFFYQGMAPLVDDQELAAKGRRLIVRHRQLGIELVIAAKDVVTSGWVVGLEEPF